MVEQPAQPACHNAKAPFHRYRTSGGLLEDELAGLSDDKTRFGALLESFAVSELMKLASWSERRISFSHYRTKDLNEVDVVIGDRRGRIIGIEVKASATVKADDFRGLRQFLDPIKHRHSQFIWAILHDPVANIGLKRWTALLIAAPYNHAIALHASEGHHGDAKYSTSRSFPYAGCKDRPRREP